ncbi:excinuclease ABC subunit UvrC [Sinobacterium caligoides]|nr:excinuclease ABC subunit UvrC [Sinobacterium caligoides]
MLAEGLAKQGKLTFRFDYRDYLKDLTQKPGVYQMYSEKSEVLYVGKAKNLKRRVSSYFRATGLTTKTMALVARIHRIEVTVTSSETEALLLEQSLIKAHLPPYNILLRDGKSYPYILLSDHETPRISYYRGKKQGGGRFFGPYPNAGAVRESLQFLQRTFLLRPCQDSVFKNRSRACLQYQIKRCSGPCVDLIATEDYRRSVEQAIMFLEGKSDQLMGALADQMEAASMALNFEKAAELRDRIGALRTIQERQYVDGESGDLDICACVVKGVVACVQVIYVRGGRILGSKSYFPKIRLAPSAAEVLSAFLPQFYLASAARDIPKEVLVNVLPEDHAIIESALSQQSTRKVAISSRVRASRSRWLTLAVNTATTNVGSRIADRQNSYQRFEALQQALGLDELPERLECFDISHSSGESTVASCVVFDTCGPKKSDYRLFNIKGITGGDDYAAMEQALTRRFKRLQKGEGVQPDILLIDGGKGQLSKAQQVIDEIGIEGVLLIGVAKGVTRKPGMEQLFIGREQRQLLLDADHPGLLLIQHIRDESHRFAITGHRQRRDKTRKTSTLEGIPGVGPKRRRELLRHFGGLQKISASSIEELMRVTGINEKIATDIYAALHND